MTSPILPPGTAARAIAGARNLVFHPTAVVEGLIPGAEGAQAGIDAIVAVRRWLSDRHNWIRVSWFGGGVVLVLAGAAMLGAGKAANLVPAGKVAKAVKGAAK